MHRNLNRLIYMKATATKPHLHVSADWQLQQILKQFLMNRRERLGCFVDRTQLWHGTTHYRHVTLTKSTVLRWVWEADYWRTVWQGVAPSYLQSYHDLCCVAEADINSRQRLCSASASERDTPSVYRNTDMSPLVTVFFIQVTAAWNRNGWCQTRLHIL